jgi:hypothetical protein
MSNTASLSGVQSGYDDHDPGNTNARPGRQALARRAHHRSYDTA